MNYEYKPIYQALLPEEVAVMIYEIQNSDKFELDDLSHVVMKISGKRVGYFGDDTLEIINPNDRTLKKHHRNLISLCNYAIGLCPKSL